MISKDHKAVCVLCSGTVQGHVNLGHDLKLVAGVLRVRVLVPLKTLLVVCKLWLMQVKSVEAESPIGVVG
ncbi:hypothetical protein TNCV_3974631 [Trichonephila clavipes]|nr:hypothetical protein TNCV_3974631 [Trichonephila clavipes]